MKKRVGLATRLLAISSNMAKVVVLAHIYVFG